MFEDNLILKTASQMHLIHVDIANTTPELVRNIFSCLSFNSLYHTGGSMGRQLSRVFGMIVLLLPLPISSSRTKAKIDTTKKRNCY